MSTSTIPKEGMGILTADEMVVIKQGMLNGSSDPDFLQCVAVVYIRGKEYRVSAPPEAKGNALDWIKHWAVRESTTEFFEGESESQGNVRVLVIRLVEEELRKHNALEPGRTGMHPDGKHCAAQICMAGHIRHCDGETFNSKEYCKECGTPCIDVCPHCSEPIRGPLLYRPASDYQRPSFCHACGRAYPWLEERLKTARELRFHDDQLTEDDRQSLWPDLQYVMSNPRSDLVPAKKKPANAASQQLDSEAIDSTQSYGCVLAALNPPDHCRLSKFLTPKDRIFRNNKASRARGLPLKKGH